MRPLPGSRSRRRCGFAASALAVAALVLGGAGCAPPVAATATPTAASGPAANVSPAADPKTALSSTAAAATNLDDALVQFSVIAALAAGDYVDGAPLRTVLDEGDFGIGTFDRLEGEMILLEGKMYQALASGEVRPADLESSTPFAAVTRFHEDGRFEGFAAASLEELDQELDRRLPRRNAPYALRIDGEFDELTLRSVPAQSPPFQPLVDVVKHQATWRKEKVRGTLIGLRCPSWVGTLNVSGYHWHFLSDDRQVGGHLLGCRFRDGLLRFDECSSILIHIPRSSGFEEFRIDRVKKQDINDIERQRTDGPRP